MFAKGPAALESALSETIEDAGNEMNALARLAVRQAQTQWHELDAHIAWCDARISAHVKGIDDIKKATQLMGISPIGASASKAIVGTSGSSRTARSSEPGWGWCQGNIHRAARTICAASRNEPTPICAACLSKARRQRS